MSALAPPVITPSPIRVGAPQKKGGPPEDARRSGDDMLNITHLSPPMNSAGQDIHAPKPGADPAGWLKAKLHQAKVLPVGDLISEVVLITPALAEHILSISNVGNRSLRGTRVAAYAEAMIEGRWKLTAQGISIARDGTLNNGQHRLYAVIRAGVAVSMNVTFGEDRGVFDILDTGANRSASDTLGIVGHKNTANLAASARVLMLIDNGTPTSNASFGNDVIKAWVQSHPALEAYTANGTSIGRKLKTSQAGVTAALYLIGTRSRHAKHLPDFVALLADGAGLTKRGPILTLRESLMRGDFVAKVRAGIAGPVVCAAILNAWNLWLGNRKGSLPALTWRAGQPFPEAR